MQLAEQGAEIARLCATLGTSAPATPAPLPKSSQPTAEEVKAGVHVLLQEAATRGRELRAKRNLVATSEVAGGRRPVAVVLTGGPGVGKTSLIDHLQNQLGCPVVPEAAIQAIDTLNGLGKEVQKAWRGEKSNTAAFGDLVGRIAMAQEAKAAASAPTDAGVILFDRTVLDNLGYSLQRGYAVPGYLNAEVAAEAFARIDHVFVLDQVATLEEIEERNRKTGRKTDIKEIDAMSASLETIYQSLGCTVTRIPKLPVAERAAFLLQACGLGADPIVSISSPWTPR